MSAEWIAIMGLTVCLLLMLFGNFNVLIRVKDLEDVVNTLCRRVNKLTDDDFEIDDVTTLVNDLNEWDVREQ